MHEMETVIEENQIFNKSEDGKSIDSVEYFEALTNLASPFNEQNVAFVFEERKLYVQKEQLVAVSPVFEAMFSDRFKEGSKAEIPLPGKNLNHFVRFLRYICPGFDDELTDDIAHLMLPLADEYQTDALRKRIENVLANSILVDIESISSEQIIMNILEAELYKLSYYLDTCILVASRKMFENLTKSPKFENFSQKTQLKISFRRWEDIDKIYIKAIKEERQAMAHKKQKINMYGRCDANDTDLNRVGQHFKPHMQDN